MRNDISSRLSRYTRAIGNSEVRSPLRADFICVSHKIVERANCEAVHVELHAVD